MSTEIALLAQAVVSCAMAGVIWLVQLVHYPLMAFVARERFVAFEREHCARIAYVVMPCMLVEAALAAWFVLRPAPTAAFGILAWVGAALVFLLFASTFFVQVPCHRVLENGFDEAAHSRLVRTNWIRTAGWTARAAVAIAMLAS